MGVTKHPSFWPGGEKYLASAYLVQAASLENAWRRAWRCTPLSAPPTKGLALCGERHNRTNASLLLNSGSCNNKTVQRRWRKVPLVAFSLLPSQHCICINNGNQGAPWKWADNDEAPRRCTCIMQLWPPQALSRGSHGLLMLHKTEKDLFFRDALLCTLRNCVDRPKSCPSLQGNCQPEYN